jgi:hypothetical protein
MSALRQFSAYTQPTPPIPRRVQPRTTSLEKQPKTSSLTVIPRVFAAISWRDLNRGIPTDGVLNSIETNYVIDSRNQVGGFIQGYRLRGLLLEAIKPLNIYFGADSIKALTLVTDDDDSESLFCLIITPGDMEEARRRLRSFDEDWWLGNSARSGGKLNFDFELI